MGDLKSLELTIKRSVIPKRKKNVFIKRINYIRKQQLKKHVDVPRWIETLTADVQVELDKIIPRQVDQATQTGIVEASYLKEDVGFFWWLLGY